MEPQLILYPARLREGHIEKIAEEVDPTFMTAEGVEFPKAVSVEGEAYMAGEHLVIHLNLSAMALVPCRICGEKTEVPLSVPDFYSAEEGASKGKFDCIPLIRAALLVELPPFVECHGGHCPHRPEMLKYLQHRSKNGYHPFKDL